MADDIDIEEHDVLDHPKIQDIFPDLSRVKTEVMDEVDDFPYEDYEGFNAAASIKLEPGTSYSEMTNYIQPNKIILGSKPTLTQIYDSSQQLTLEDLGNPDINAFVLIENMGPELERSDCYCEKCETLFATVNALDAHKMIAHSFLVAVESRNTAIKSTAKKQGAEESVTFCNHCNNTFPDNASLITHLYNVMNLKCDECSLEFKTEKEKSLHQELHIVSSSEPKSLVYRCSVCKCFFGKEIFLKTHMEGNHKIPANKVNLKRCLFEKKCFFCSSYFGTLRSYKDHVRKHHYNYFFKVESHEEIQSQNPVKLGLNVAKKTPVVVKTSISAAKPAPSLNVSKNPFKCLLCNMEIKYILYHKKRFHPKLNVSEIPIKKLGTGNIFNTVSAKPKSFALLPFSKTKYNLTQIPKNTLFKCPTCEVHFLAAYALMAHSRSCKQPGNKTFSPLCSVADCQRKFRGTDMQNHELQHQLTSTFLVYVLERLVFANTLNKCGKCGCMVNDLDFAPHMQECDGIASEIDCDICKIEIHSKSYRVHMKRHGLKKIDPKRLKIIEYVLISDIKSQTSQIPAPVPSLKRKLPDEITEKAAKQMKLTSSTEIVPNQIKPTSKYKLFVCRHCLCVMPTRKTIKQHRERICVPLKKIICKHCGLLVTSSSSKLHYTLHTGEGLGLNNFGFFDLFTLKMAPAPITKLPYCEECRIYYGTFLSFRQHNCTKKVPTKVCPYCKLHIEHSFFNNHVNLHEINMRLGKNKKDVDMKLAMNKKVKVMPEEKDAGEIPDLLKMYQSLKTTWNILYMCQICEIVTDSYDVAVEHSQWHFSCLESYSIVLKECNICKLKFKKDCINRHLELHKNTRVNKNSFNILRYDYKTLHTRKWFEMFKEFSDDQIRQIVSMSMYEHTRSVKLELDKDGSKDGTLYKCATCYLAVAPADLRKHVDEDDCLRPEQKQLLLECTTCNITFSSQKMYVQHCVCHGGSSQPIRVLLFNKPEDEAFNLAMTSSAANEANYSFVSDKPPQNIVKPMPKLKQTTLDSVLTSNKPGETARKGKLFCFYRCRKCNSTLTDKKKLNLHSCSRRLIKCLNCGLHIYTNFYKKHVSFHKSNKAYNRNNFKITDFIITDSRRVKFLTSKNLSSGTAPSTLPTHMKSYSNAKTRKTNVFFKCSQCNLCFLCDKSLVRHVALGPTRDSVPCEQCGLHFNTLATVKKHKLYHHVQHKLKVDDFRFVTRNCGHSNRPVFKDLSEKETAKSNSPKNVIPEKITFYQCYMCPVLLESIRHLENHMRKSLDVHNVPRVPCGHCGLIFSRTKIVNHRALHEKFNLTAADFIVKTNTVLQCKKCSLNFHWSINFKRHVEKSLCTDESVEKEKCGVCGIDFFKADLQRHTELFHTVLNLKVSDITFVNKVDCVEKRYLAGYDLSSGFPIKQEKVENGDLDTCNQNEEVADDIHQDPATIYKCYECGLHFMSTSQFLDHFETKSKSNIEEMRDTCSVCDIDFTTDSMHQHVSLHHEKLKLNKENFTVKEIFVLYKCSCQICFHSLRSLRIHLDSKHGLSINKIKCSYCDYTFSRWNLRRHMKISHIDRDIKREDFRIIVHKCVQDVPLPETDDAPTQISIDDAEEISPKVKTKPITYTYPTNSFVQKTSQIEQNNEMEASNTSGVDFSRTIYKCYECGLHFVTPQQLVMHFESKSKYYRHKIVAQCKACTLEFTRDGITGHQRLHHDDLKLNKERFIVKEMFLLYGCTCDMYFHHVNSLLRHIDNNHGQIKYKINCKYCNYTFSTANIKKHEKLFHEDRNINREDFTILTHETLPKAPLKAIVDECESDAGPMGTSDAGPMDTSDAVPVDISDAGLMDTSDTGPVDTSYEGPVDTSYEGPMDTSGAGPMDTSTANLTASTSANREISKIENSKNIVSFENNLDDVSRTIYKCYECSLHFVSFALLKIHFENTAKYNVEDIKINCGHCHLQFTFDGLEYHKELHHEKLKMNRKDFTVKVIYILYQCSCDICFHQPNSLKSHLGSNHGLKKTVVQCKYCDYKFSFINIRRHTKMFHRDRKVKREDFTILGPDDLCSAPAIKPEIRASKSNDSIREDPVKKSVSDVVSMNTSPKPITSIPPTNAKYKLKLYKCKPCNVYFLSQNSCYKHATKHEPMDPKEYIECKLCNLQFSFMSLHIHMKKHHIQQEYKPEDILVEEYLPSVGQNAPILNIYYLKDRLQSELVSTTSEILKDNTEKSVQPPTSESLKDTATSSSIEKSVSPPTVEILKDTDSSSEEKSLQTPTSEILKGTATSSSIEKSGSPPTVEIFKDIAASSSEENPPTIEILKDTPGSISIEESSSPPAQDECKEIKKSEMISGDSNETDVLKFTKDATPKVYKRKSKDSNESPTNKPNREIKTEPSKNNEPAVVNDVASNLTEKANDASTNEKLTAVAEEKGDFTCELCEESFKTSRALEFHINLDHIDEVENCAICKASLNKSILITMHLESFNDHFKCCICKEIFKADDLQTHALLHR